MLRRRSNGETVILLFSDSVHSDYANLNGSILYFTITDFIYPDAVFHFCFDNYNDDF